MHIRIYMYFVKSCNSRLFSIEYVFGYLSIYNKFDEPLSALVNEDLSKQSGFMISLELQDFI